MLLPNFSFNPPPFNKGFILSKKKKTQGTDRNVSQSYVFRDKRLGLTARHVRAHGAVAESVLPTQQPFSGSGSFPSDKKTPTLSIRVPSSHYSTDDVSPSKKSESPFKMFSPARAFRAARESLPSYTSSRTKSAASKDEEDSHKPPMTISSPLNVNPQFAHLIKPEPARHPSQRKGEGSSWA